RAGRAIETEDMAIVRAYDNEIAADRRCADDFRRKLCVPAISAIARSKCVEGAFECAGDDEIAIDAGSAAESHRVVAAMENETAAFASLFVPQAAAGRSVERFDRAGSARGVEFAVGI